MAAENRLTYLLHTNNGKKQTINVFVSNGIPGVSTKLSSKESDCDNDWQPEIVIWPPKPEVLISLEL